jgi:DNA repair exonuclease SbcCD ATPase subunit
MSQLNSEFIRDSHETTSTEHDAQALQMRLDSAYTSESDAGDIEFAPQTESESLSFFAQAAARQARILHELREEFAWDSEATHLKETMRELCAALSGIANQVKRTSSEAAAKIESLTDMLAMVAGQIASQREQLKASHDSLSEDTEALAKRLARIETNNDVASELSKLHRRMDAEAEASANGRVEDLQLLGQGIEANRGEISELRERIAANADASAKALAAEMQQLHASLDSNRGEITKLYERIESVDHVMLQGFGVLRDNLTVLRKELQQTNQRMAGLESGTASYSATEKTVEAMGRRLGALEEKEQSNTARVQLVEQAAEQFSKREDVMARAARMLMSGQ